MKKMTKKLGAVVLAMAMCFSLCCVAFADDDEPEETKYTITISNAASGETYTAYKIFDVTYNDDLSSYAYTIAGDSVWFSTVQNAKVDDSNLFTLTQITGTNTYVVTAKDGISDEDIAAVFTTVPDGAVAAATATAATVADEKTGETGTTTVTLDVTNSGPGYYFVTTSLGSVVSIDTTNPAATIQDKNPVPTLTKEVTNESHTGTYEQGTTGEGDSDTANIGDILEFEITISNAAHKSALCLHDYTSQGLTYHGDSSIHVYLNETYNLVNAANYTIQSSNCTDGCDFEIVFEAEWLDDLDDDDVIIITYEAVVNEAALVVNTNDAFLTYGTAGHSVVVETETDTFGFGLEKVDGNGDLLEGATFTLADSNGSLVKFVTSTDDEDEENNATIYTVYDSVDDPDEEEETTTEIKVGYALIFGLDAGTYTLTETEAPDGYNKLTSAITVTVSDTGVVSISGVDSTVATATDGMITVVNNEGSILPGTGGMGTTIFYIIGGVLVVGAVVVLVTRRRMTRED